MPAQDIYHFRGETCARKDGWTFTSELNVPEIKLVKIKGETEAEVLLFAPKNVLNTGNY